MLCLLRLSVRVSGGEAHKLCRVQLCYITAQVRRLRGSSKKWPGYRWRRSQIQAGHHQNWRLGCRFSPSRGLEHPWSHAWSGKPPSAAFAATQKPLDCPDLLSMHKRVPMRRTVRAGGRTDRANSRQCRCHQGSGVVKVLRLRTCFPPQGNFYAEAVVCAFMHAADSGVSVTSNSYYTDPWLFTCRYDPAQDAIYTAVNRWAGRPQSARRFACGSLFFVS